MSSHMRLPGAVTSLTASVGSGLVARCDAFEVRIPIEPKPYVRMARLTDHAADVVSARRHIRSGSASAKHQRK